MTDAGYFGLLDCNNFYVSCERVFNPKIKGKPVVVLSNNDGCVISRSQEAKDLGVPMGALAFEFEEFFRKHQVVVYSSNYTLYGDMSARVVDTIRNEVPLMEVYSIDESFLWWPKQPAKSYLKNLRERVLRHTGIPVCIGVAKTKTLSKLANRIAKKSKGAQPVHVLAHGEHTDSSIGDMEIGDVWGIGSRLSKRLAKHGIQKISDFQSADPVQIRSMMGVVGERTLRELNGVSCIPLELTPPFPKMITSSRSFGKPVDNFEDMRDALSAYITTAAAKLRYKQGLCSSMRVFVMTNRHRENPYFAARVKHFDPTSSTQDLLETGELLLEQCYRSGLKYVKCGVDLAELQPVSCYQLPLFQDESKVAAAKVVDLINKQLGRDKITFGVKAKSASWHNKRNRLSSRYTTCWSDLLKVHAH